MLRDIVCPVSVERLNKRACRVGAVLTPVPMDKAPKVFAWRVGFLMAAATAVVLPFSIVASRYIALALAAFNILDGICNFCVGCIIYTYFILPRVRPTTLEGAL